ncbi:MAG: hypothetical protein HWD85_03260 [Flavobacteriaceae bacterium]|nr:hypothetical protein [Flavobacteriaceae bacterium]
MNKLVDNHQTNQIIWLLRIAVAFCFLGHGLIAIGKNAAWIPYLEVFGIKGDRALEIMFIIGVVDILVALFVLIKPFRIVILWACFWTFATALIRPISGESIWAFIERAPNWITPIALYLFFYRNNT